MKFLIAIPVILVAIYIIGVVVILLVRKYQAIKSQFEDRKEFFILALQWPFRHSQIRGMLDDDFHDEELELPDVDVLS